MSINYLIAGQLFMLLLSSADSLVLIRVQTVRQCYQQKTNIAASKKRANKTGFR